MEKIDLRFVAESLLALCEGESKLNFYSDAALERKLLQSRHTDPVWALAQLRHPGDALFEAECREIVSRARLTERQRDVLCLRVVGVSFDQIGRRFGATRQGAQHVFVQALRKISRACRVYPYRGLADVYRFETRRGRP
ncbi:MAG: hypothetical protein SFX74_03020 [Fimbriimonadaceae bacterium]|nr:hypothetical protein [Fimbriimonadaceae bacterium]